METRDCQPRASQGAPPLSEHALCTHSDRKTCPQVMGRSRFVATGAPDQHASQAGPLQAGAAGSGSGQVGARKFRGEVSLRPPSKEGVGTVAFSVAFILILRRKVISVLVTRFDNICNNFIRLTPFYWQSGLFPRLGEYSNVTQCQRVWKRMWSEAFGCRCWAFLMLAPACTALRLGSLLASLSRLTHIL